MGHHANRQRTDYKALTVVLGVADENRRLALRTALDAAVTVVHNASSVGQALAAVSELVPDVVVLDEGDDRREATEACWLTLSNFPATRSVLLAGADDETAYEALLHGAFSVMRLDAAPSTVVDAVIGATRGESIVVAGVARMLLDDAKYAASRDRFTPLVRLTSTEQEVLTRLGGGLSPAEIAALHGVTARLVNLHTGYAVAKVHHHVQRVRARDAMEPVNLG